MPVHQSSMLQTVLVSVIAVIIFLVLVRSAMRQDERADWQGRGRVRPAGHDPITLEGPRCAWCKGTLGESPDGRHCVDCVDKLAV